MKKIFFLICFILSLPTTALADNVILMIGDGMGKNHIQCTNQKKNLFLSTLTPKGEIKTYSENNAITDSAASATAYACGIKTNNNYLAMNSNKETCETLAEMSAQKGYLTLIRTTDKVTGATPSAFYAHTESRYDTKKIEEHLKKALKKMDIQSVQQIDQEMRLVLNQLKNSDKPFFMMVEESEIDTQSHHNNLEKMQAALIRFDKAIQQAIEFAKEDKKTTVIILADHETGGLTNTCTYTKKNHSDANVFYFVEGQHASLFNEPILENNAIHHKMKRILFNQ